MSFNVSSGAGGVPSVLAEDTTQTGASPSMLLVDDTGAEEDFLILVDAGIVNLRDNAQADGTLLALDLPNNRVGIGTDSPASTLEIGSGVVLAPDGTAGAPTYSFSSDPNSGLYNSSADVLIMATGGAARVIFENEGLRINVTGSAATPSIRINDLDTGFFLAGSNMIGMATAGSEAVRIDASGNVGINTTTPGFLLDVNGAANITGAFTSPGAGTNSFKAGTGAAAAGNTSVAIGNSAGDGTLGAASVAVGNASDANGAGSVAIGDRAGDGVTGAGAVSIGLTSEAAGTNAVAVGATAEAAGNGSVAIGQAAGNSGVGGGSVSIGINSEAAGSTSVSIGQSAGDAGTGTNAVCIGNNSDATAVEGVALGGEAKANFADSIALGANSITTAVNQLVIGGVNSLVTSVYIGEGVTSTTPDSFTLNATGGSGTDIAGASMTLSSGQGTGTGAGGELIFKTATLGTTGSSLNALTTRLTIDDTSGNAAFTSASNSASDIFGLTVTSNNAGAGVPGGIDMSSFSVDEPLLAGTADAITTAGTVSHQIPVDIGGTIFYIALTTHGS